MARDKVCTDLLGIQGWEVTAVVIENTDRFSTSARCGNECPRKIRFMITAGERFEEIFQKHAAILDSEPGDMRTENDRIHAEWT